MKTSEQIEAMIKAREAQLSKLHIISCSLDAATLKRVPWLSKRIAEIVGELVLLQEVLNG